MIRWIRRVFGLCEHEWILIKEGYWKDDLGSMGRYKDYQCKKCLKPKVVKW